MLHEIQARLKAPKDKKNSFGNYHYRNAEAILESVKPVLAEFKACILLKDEMVEVGGRVYVKATAQLCIEPDSTNNPQPIVFAESTAFAREQVAKKGMDEAQITGAASSYARKYALSGLLAIDDSRDDPDTKTAEDNEIPAQHKLEDYKEVIQAIKEAIAEGDLSTAAEEWFTLDVEVKPLLWVAPSKGGPFTTKEREVIKSTEFRQAYYGVENKEEA